jgi:hypothetical protein
MMQTQWTTRARTVTEILSYVARRPSRAPEIRAWIRDRGRTTIDSRTPWWPYAAIQGVREALPPAAVVFEFGGGGSTLWLHDLGARVTCVEHHREWFGSLRQRLPEDVTLALREPTSTGAATSESEPGNFFDDYVCAVTEQADSTIDLVIVDGRARVACGLAAMSKIRPGGMLLLDDSDRPRYRPLLEALNGWDRTDYTGLKIGGGPPCRTTVWRRPVAH